jgi:hypothetical protein
VQVHSASPSAIVVPTGWSRITAANSAIVLGYRASSAAFSSQKGTVSYNSITTAAIGGIAAFNGDDQVAGGQPYAKRWGGVPHWGGRSQRRW